MMVANVFCNMIKLRYKNQINLTKLHDFLAYYSKM